MSTVSQFNLEMHHFQPYVQIYEVTALALIASIRSCFFKKSLVTLTQGPYTHTADYMKGQTPPYVLFLT